MLYILAERISTALLETGRYISSVTRYEFYTKCPGDPSPWNETIFWENLTTAHWKSLNLKTLYSLWYKTSHLMLSFNHCVSHLLRFLILWTIPYGIPWWESCTDSRGHAARSCCWMCWHETCDSQSIMQRHGRLALWHQVSPQGRSQFVNTLRPRQNGRHFAADIFKCTFLNKVQWQW